MSEPKLHPTANAFLDALGLPSAYPYGKNVHAHVDIFDGSNTYNYDTKRMNSALHRFLPTYFNFANEDSSSPSPTTQQTETMMTTATSTLLPVPITEQPRLDFKTQNEKSIFWDPPNHTSSSLSFLSCPATLNNSVKSNHAQPTSITHTDKTSPGFEFIQSVKQCVYIISMSFKQVAPGVVAASHLFFRLFLPITLLVVILYLVLLEPLVMTYHGQQQQQKERKQEPGNETIISKDKNDKCIFDDNEEKKVSIASYLTSFRTFVLFLGLLCTVVAMTDAMYVLEYGRVTLLLVHLIFCMLTLGVSSMSHHRCKQLDIMLLILPMTIMGVVLMVTTDLDLPTSISPGFYYDKSNPSIFKIVQDWPVESRLYDSKATPWAVNGDTRTGIPFFLNNIPNQVYIRRWVPSNVPGEEEAIILDIAFPPDGIHRKNKPLYLVLCGLVGGSQEEYVKDLVFHKRQEGSTVAVMITRGLMESTVQGEELLNFARVSDIDAAAKALRKAVQLPQDNDSNNHKQKVNEQVQVVAGVGYSMGAINLANYVARSGSDCALDAAVTFSGALDTRHQIHFHRSRKFWQPLLVKNLRDLIIGKFQRQLQKRLTAQEIEDIAVAPTVVDFDERYTIKYHNFDTIESYYSQMGAMGDFTSFDNNVDDGTTSSTGPNPKDHSGGVGRIANVSIPLLVVNALDDPIAYPKCLGNDPQRVSTSGSGFTLLLITEKGGHVGWPIGMNPATTGWIWMSTVASSFVDSVQRNAVIDRQVRRQKNSNE